MTTNRGPRASTTPALDNVEREGPLAAIASPDDASRRQRLAMDAAFDGIALLDADARFTYLNLAHVRLFGYDDAAELIGESWHRLYDVAEIRRIETTVLPVLARDGLWAGDARATRRDGTTFDEGLSLTLLDGGGLICVCRDISATRRAAEEHERLSAIVESSDDAIVSKDLEGVITSWNAAAERMFGYSSAEAVGQPITIIVPAERLDEERANLARLRRGERIDHIETQRVTRDGRRVDVSLTVSPLRDLHGAVVGASKIARDISDRKRAELALRETEERLRLMVDHGEHGLWSWEPQTGAAFGDERWWGIHGYKADGGQASHELWLSTVHLDDAPGVMAALEAHETGRTPLFDVEYRARRKDDRWIWVNARGRIQSRDAHGRPVRWMGSVHDVSARRQAEAERERLEEQVRLAQRFESLGVLAGGIAHDFNNLLMVILGNVTLAQNELPGDAKGALARLKAIEKASTRASELTQQMLAYAGKRPVARQTLALDVLVGEIVTLLTTVVSKKAELDLALEPVQAEGDASQLHQVVMNLVTNASEALADRPGRIRVSTRVEWLERGALHSPYLPTSPEPGPFAVLTVEDNGDGIGADALPKIFEPFYSTKFLGRGLGLAAVLGIVRGHRGTVMVASELGKGTTFRVAIPATFSAAATGTDGGPTATIGPTRTLLVVDDEAMVRDYVQAALTQAGYGVIEAVNGVEALAVLERRRADVSAVVLDLAMPLMDGADVLRVMKQRMPEIPVLLMSGYGADTVNARLPDGERVSVVQKPIGAPALVERVRQLLSP